MDLAPHHPIHFLNGTVTNEIQIVVVLEQALKARVDNLLHFKHSLPCIEIPDKVVKDGLRDLHDRNVRD